MKVRSNTLTSLAPESCLLCNASVFAQYAPPNPNGRVETGSRGNGPALSCSTKPLVATKGSDKGAGLARCTEQPDAHDLELLTSILALATGAGNATPLAYRALSRFGNIGKVLSATQEELLSVPGFGTDATVLVKLLQYMGQRLLRARILDSPLPPASEAVTDYLRSLLARAPIEYFRILFLDSNGWLLADEAFGQGTVNHAPVYPREVARRARALGAVEIVLAHNHPSGDPTPSLEDLNTTKQVHDALSVFGIRVRDHIIVGRSGHTSFAAMGLIE